MMQRLEMEAMTVVKCTKVCRKCSKVWRGNFFKEWVVRAPKQELPAGKQAIVSECDDCIDAWERKRALQELEHELDVLDGAGAAASSEAKRARLIRAKVNVLKKIRTWHDVGSQGWTDINARIQKVEAA